MFGFAPYPKHNKYRNISVLFYLAMYMDIQNIEQMLRDIAAGQVVLFEKLSKIEDKQHNRLRSGVDYKKEFGKLIDEVKRAKLPIDNEGAF